MAGYGVALVVCLAALIQISSAATHTVGDSTGWTIPSGSSFYSTWAGKQTFKVGDVLVFNFQSGQHTVAEVSKSAYDACTTSNPISSFTTGPANVNITTGGAHYYICTISGHCSAGQKLAITATGTSSPSPSSSPKSSPAPAASKTPASAPTPSTSKTPASSPTPSSSKSPAAAQTPSTPTTPSGSAPSPAGAKSPASSPESPAGSTTPPPSSPSSATTAAAGLVLPILLVVGALLF